MERVLDADRVRGFHTEPCRRDPQGGLPFMRDTHQHPLTGGHSMVTDI